jgi:hypothetical protein
MTIALIAAGVVAFLAFDTYVMWKVFGSGNRSAVYGSVAAPGEATLELPAGKAKLTYQESVYSSQSSSPIRFWAPDSLEVSISGGPSGRELDLNLKGDGPKQTVAGWLPGGPRSRVRLGYVEVPAAGRYSVKVSGGGKGPRPQVLLGR